MLKENTGFKFIIVFIVFSAALIFSSNVFAAGNMSIPDLTGITEFSPAANYMSLEGFVIHYCKANYGVKISRGEAGEMIKAQKNGTSVSQRTAVTEDNYNSMHNNSKHHHSNCCNSRR